MIVTITISYLLVSSTFLLFRSRENRWKKRGIALTPTKFGISFTAFFMNQVKLILYLKLNQTTKGILSSKRPSENSRKANYGKFYSNLTDPEMLSGCFQRWFVTPCGDEVVSWLARSSPDREVRVRTLARDTVVCSLLGKDT